MCQTTRDTVCFQTSCSITIIKHSIQPADTRNYHSNQYRSHSKSMFHPTFFEPVSSNNEIDLNQWQKPLDMLLRTKGANKFRIIQRLSTLQSAQHFLQNLPAAGQVNYNEKSSRRRSLPGLGHPFWKTARDHMKLHHPPPSIQVNLNYFMGQVTESIKERLVLHLKESWACSDETENRRRIFHCDYEQAMVFNTNSGTPVIRIPVHKNPILDQTTYQNGDKLQEDNIRLFHGTRQPIIKPILTEGLMSSIRSHDVTGLWANTNLETSLAWTSSIFDIVPSLAVEVVAPISAKRQNRRIKAGNPERMVIELRTDQTLPALHISAIIVTIPTPTRLQFNSKLKQVMWSTSEYLRSINTYNPNSLTCLDIMNFLWSLCSFRYAYVGTEGAMDPEFGATMDSIPQCVVLPSIHFVAALYYVVQIKSYTNLQHRLASISESMLPPPMRSFMLQESSGIQFFWKQSDDNTIPPSWKSWEMIPVRKWGPIQEYKENDATKHLFQASSDRNCVQSESEDE